MLFRAETLEIYSIVCVFSTSTKYFSATCINSITMYVAYIASCV